MKNNYCVYKHTMPNNKVYIGITCRKPEIRWSNGCGYKTNKHFFNAILKYGWENIKHEILFTDLTKEEACKIEIELIEKYNSTNENYGFNHSTGGDCVSLGVSFTKERKEKISSALKGKVRSKSHCEHISQAKKGKHHTEEQKIKIKINNIGKHKGKLNGRSRPVIQYDLEGNYIKTFDYTRQASEETNTERTSIINCCKGKYKQAGGFKWSYAN